MANFLPMHLALLPMTLILADHCPLSMLYNLNVLGAVVSLVIKFTTRSYIRACLN